MDWSLERGAGFRSTADWIDNRHRAYRAGKVSEEAICGEMVQMYAGLREDELVAAAARYYSDVVRPRIFPELVALIAALRRGGTEFGRSAPPTAGLLPRGRGTLASRPMVFVAAEVRVTNGLITSDLVAVSTDEGKAVALRGVGLNQPDAVLGNSIHDLAMLDMARHAFPVNPSLALLEAAAGRGWGYFRPATADALQSAMDGGEGPAG